MGGSSGIKERERIAQFNKTNLVFGVKLALFGFVSLVSGLKLGLFSVEPAFLG